MQSTSDCVGVLASSSLIETVAPAHQGFSRFPFHATGHEATRRHASSNICMPDREAPTSSDCSPVAQITTTNSQHPSPYPCQPALASMRLRSAVLSTMTWTLRNNSSTQTKMARSGESKYKLRSSPMTYAFTTGAFCSSPKYATYPLGSSPSNYRAEDGGGMQRFTPIARYFLVPFANHVGHDSGAALGTCNGHVLTVKLTIARKRQIIESDRGGSTFPCPQLRVGQVPIVVWWW